ncbi:WD repeat-containing protein wrap73, partial [Nowakowskiella sp. JEL0078]
GNMAPTAMDFTELYKQTSNLCVFSPNGVYLATAVQYRVVIRDSQTLQILHLFSFPDAVQQLLWAADSTLILAASHKTSRVYIWSIEDTEWSAKIEDGVAGIVNVRWTPDARSVLCFSEFQMRIAVWSLIDKVVRWIQNPNYPRLSFRIDGRYLAVLESKDCKDSVAIIDCEDWSLIRRFSVDTSDTEDISWSPDGQFIAVWSSILEYKLVVYHLDGKLASQYVAYDVGLGIKSVSWSASGQLLAVASFDQKVRLLNHYTFKPLNEFCHTPTLSGPNLLLLREVDNRENSEAISSSNLPLARYEVIDPPVMVPTIRSDHEKPNPKMGVGICKFNSIGSRIATRNDNMPNCLWIWDILNLRQSCFIQQLLPIKVIEWNPIEPELLAFSCSNGSVYLWGGDDYGCEAFEIPAVNFTVMSFRWNSDGKSIVLMDKDKFCVAFPIEENHDFE